MEIQIVWGKGNGVTPVSSFDLAMKEAGINNFNLVLLTSVIPRGASVRKMGVYKNRKNRKVGEILNVVMARNISKGPCFVSAGLSWIQGEEGGIFLEMTGERSKDVQRELETGLEEMMKAREWTWRTEIESIIVETHCSNVGCALVVAVYEL